MELTVQFLMSWPTACLHPAATTSLAAPAKPWRVRNSRAGGITKPERRRLLGFRTRYRSTGSLKSHEVYEDYTRQDFERDRDDLKQLGYSNRLQVE